MNTQSAIWRKPTGHAPVHPALWLMVGVMVLIQAIGDLALAEILPPIFHPVWIYTLLAFFDGQFELARSGVSLEPQLVWSTLTYAFVHGGWLHLLMNATIFLALGHMISHTVGIGRTILIFALTAIAGALTFGLISNAQGPMVGASGAVFGLLGVVARWRFAEFRAYGMSPAPVFRLIVGLVAINVILALGVAGLGGSLAWEAHLGGFIAGWLLAGRWRPSAGATHHAV